MIKIKKNINEEDLSASLMIDLREYMPTIDRVRL